MTPPADATDTADAADIAGSFGRAAARYRAHARIPEAMAEWVAQWLPAPADRRGRALELGAGPGVFTSSLLPWAGPLLATDLSPEMCAEGARRLSGVNWRVAAAEAPPPGPWDWIFSSSMYQWIADPVAAFSAARGELAPGGRILGGLYAAPTIPEWNEIARPLAAFEWRSGGQWIAALRSAGLNILRSEAKTVRFEFPSALEFLRSVHAIGAAPARRTPPGRLRSLLRAYDGAYGIDGRAVRSTWTFFRFEATR